MEELKKEVQALKRELEQKDEIINLLKVQIFEYKALLKMQNNSLVEVTNDRNRLLSVEN